MDDYALKRQLSGELEETLRLKRLNLELMDALESTMLYLLRESKTKPNWKRIRSLLKRVHSLYDEIYGSSADETYHNDEPTTTDQPH